MKITKSLGNTANQPFTFDDLRGKYNSNIQIKFKNSMLKSRLWDYKDAHIFVKGSIAITGEKEPPTGRTDKGNKECKDR